MTASDRSFMPATELAGLFRTKKLSPVDLTCAFLDRIGRINPIVNAFCAVTADAAVAAAREAEQAVMKGPVRGPLHGIPFSIKDLLYTKGVRTMSGSCIFEQRVVDVDPPVVRRLLQAGGVMLGKTTTPEFGWKGLGDSPLTGITRNPWNTGMTTGGSSAGAGAATAAGLGPLHQGSDGAGSIRIPSGFCGIFGLKPSYGRVPMWPISNNDYASHMGPMTRTVADAALMLSVMAGPDDWDRTSLEAAPDDYVGRLDRGIKGLKVAFSADPRLLGPRAAALRELRPARAADALGGRVPGRALKSRALVPARVGLDPLGLVQLSLQLPRSARRVGPRRVHASRVAGRAPDRGPSLRGSGGVTGLRGVRSGAPLGPAPPGARLTRVIASRAALL